MNRLFDMTVTQLRFVGIVCAVTLVCAGYLFMRTHTRPSNSLLFGSGTVESLPDSLEYIGIFVLDPNTAPADSLELIKGIGLVLAGRIVHFRKEQKFESVEDIMKVNGIGPKTFERIKPYLRVRTK